MNMQMPLKNSLHWAEPTYQIIKNRFKEISWKLCIGEVNNSLKDRKNQAGI